MPIPADQIKAGWTYEGRDSGGVLTHRRAVEITGCVVSYVRGRGKYKTAIWHHCRLKTFRAWAVRRVPEAEIEGEAK